jgi:hypothetical protein
MSQDPHAILYTSRPLKYPKRMKSNAELRRRLEEKELMKQTFQSPYTFFFPPIAQAVGAVSAATSPQATPRRHVYRLPQLPPDYLATVAQTLCDHANAEGQLYREAWARAMGELEVPKSVAARAFTLCEGAARGVGSPGAGFVTAPTVVNALKALIAGVNSQAAVAACFDLFASRANPQLVYKATLDQLRLERRGLVVRTPPMIVAMIRLIRKLERCPGDSRLYISFDEFLMAITSPEDGDALVTAFLPQLFVQLDEVSSSYVDRRKRLSVASTAASSTAAV